VTPGVFIDRDGTLIEEVNFLHRPEQVKLTANIISAIKSANSKNIPVIVISNQSGVGRGLFTEKDVNDVHNHIQTILNNENCFISGFYFCPHHIGSQNPIYNQKCDCRKPGSKSFLDASQNFDINLKKSVMIGDKMLDLHSATNLEMQPVLVETGYGKETFLSNELPPRTIVCGNASLAIQWFLEKIEKVL